MRYAVFLTTDAEQDLAEIYDYIALNDSPQKADQVLDRLIDAAEALAEHPERGSYPQELRKLGIREFRQVFFKPYRVIYRVIAAQAVIYVIADGRREMQELLTGRLLGN
jgi:toxin ParE1/3/4